MPLRRGFTRFHGYVLNEHEARHFRNMERRLRRKIDAGSPLEAQMMLTEIKAFVGDHEMYQQIFEAVRQDASDRWIAKWGRSWKADSAQMEQPQVP
jgi:hypothetical protein